MKPDVLHHVSETPDIALFHPRSHPRHEHAVVWAVDPEHLPNYLLPRDCPRVTFYALPESRPEDMERLMGGGSAKRVVAIESTWMARVRECRLYRYDLPPETFTPLDPGAGYYFAYEEAVPRSVTPIEDVLDALLQHDVELRVMPSLWRLREAVIASTLQFSIIRMRNATPPAEGYDAYHPM
jgi:hypothetical protein